MKLNLLILVSNKGASIKVLVDLLQQFDCNGNLLHKISTRLAASSYGEDELMSLIQS